MNKNKRCAWLLLAYIVAFDFYCHSLGFALSHLNVLLALLMHKFFSIYFYDCKLSQNVYNKMIKYCMSFNVHRNKSQTIHKINTNTKLKINIKKANEYEFKKKKTMFVAQKWFWMTSFGSSYMAFVIFDWRYDFHRVYAWHFFVYSIFVTK